jgi:uncharacterized membrane protein
MLQEWELRRNCSISPGQLGCVFGSLGAVCMAIAVFFWFAGAPFVLLFAGVEIVALGTAFLVYARHARDGERIYLAADALRVERQRGGKQVIEQFNPHWVRVELDGEQKRSLRLGESGRAIEVGRYVNAQRRETFAKELMSALRRI